MNLQRFRELVRSYGAAPDRWPEEERQAALDLAGTSSEAEFLMRQEAELDSFLDGFDLPEVVALEIEVPATRRLELLFNWLLPDLNNLKRTLWRPVMVAMAPLMIGIVIGLSTPTESTYALTTDEELILMAMTDYAKGVWLDE